MSQSIHCSGANTASGGEYEEIHCSGSLKIQGDTACQALQNSGALKLAGSLVCTEELHSSGALRVEGAIRTGRARVSGSLKSEGDLHCSGDFRCSGSTALGGSLQVGSGSISGVCSVGGTLHGGELRVSGKLTAQEVEAESFTASGKLEISGLLNAEKIEIEVSGSNEVGDIGGGTITVRRISHGLSFGERVLRVKSIEGDTVDLECTQAEVVRGKNIRIGRNCRIGRVEHSGDLTVEGGEVGEQVRI